MSSRRFMQGWLCLFALALLGLAPQRFSALAAAEAPPKSQSPAEDRFAVMEYVVEGNQVLSAPAIEAAVYPHLGEGRSITDVEAARTALEKIYHEAGYLTVFVNIPEQKVDTGVVRLQVVEGAVERLRVSGSRYYSLGRIKSRVPELAEGNVPYFPDVQKQLADLSRSADRKITPVLRPGREPGKVEVELKVADQLPLHGSVELNDRYSADTSRTRLSGNIRWDNLWQREHSLGISYQVAPENPADSKAISATYSIPLASGNYVAAYAVRSKSDVASLGTLGVIGNGDIVGLRYIMPLRGRSDFFHNLTLGMDYKNFSQTVSLQGADSFNTPISYLPFSVSWDGTWVGKEMQTRANIAANFHVRGLVGDAEEFAVKRFKASAGYFYLRGSLEHSRTWESGMALKLKSALQLTDQPLVSNEQFALGGAESVRGYLESETLGDYGVQAGLEWRSPHASWKPGIDDWYAIAFLEGGRVAIRDPLPSQSVDTTLASAGLGLRLQARKSFKAGLDVAWPLRDGSRTQAGDERVHFSLSYGF